MDSAYSPVMNIEHPKFVTVPLADGLKWRGGGGWRYEEKMDGVWSVKSFDGAMIAGEQMKSGSFYAFDVISYGAMDFRNTPLSERLACLDGLTLGALRGRFMRPAVGTGGEFLEAVLARGGEGVVAKQLDAPFGAEWFKCKRVITLDLIVTEKNQSGAASIRLGELNGEDRGWCSCRSDYDNIRVGDIVEIAAYGLTAKGKLREPRFIRIRPDKTKEMR